MKKGAEQICRGKTRRFKPISSLSPQSALCAVVGLQIAVAVLTGIGGAKDKQGKRQEKNVKHDWTSPSEGM